MPILHTQQTDETHTLTQDIFDAGLVMGETDFSRLSYRHAGRLPGIDIAYLADGAAYHTGLDTMARLRPGVLQVEWGTVWHSCRLTVQIVPF